MPPAMNAPAERPLMMRPPPRSVIDGSTACVQSSGPSKVDVDDTVPLVDGHVAQPVRRQVAS